MICGLAVNTVTTTITDSLYMYYRTTLVQMDGLIFTKEVNHLIYVTTIRLVVTLY